MSDLNKAQEKKETFFQWTRDNYTLSYYMHIGYDNGLANMIQELLFQAGYDWLLPSGEYRKDINYLVFYPVNKTLFRSTDEPYEDPSDKIEYVKVDLQKLKEIIE